MNQTATVVRVRRWCLRCTQCLRVAFAESPQEPKFGPCALCRGAVECMGYVRAGSNVAWTDHERTACDERCTNAPGFKCECSCGGVNHGTGATVEYQTGQPLPRTQRDADAKLFAKVGEWRKAKADAWRRVRRNPDYRRLRAACAVARRTGRFPWLERDEWDRTERGKALVYLIRKASAMRSHAGRMKAISEVAAQ